MSDDKDESPGWPEVMFRIVVGVAVGALIGKIINSFFELSHFKSNLITFSSIIIFALLIFNCWMGFWQLVVGFISEGIDNNSNSPNNTTSNQKDDT